MARAVSFAIVALLGSVAVARGAPGGAAADEPSDELVPSPAAERDGPPQGPAAADQAEGRRLYHESVRALAARDYARAIEQLEASYAKAPAPALLYNLGQAFRLKGDCPEALAFYRQFMATNPVGLPRERTEARIADMERCVAKAAATTKAATTPSRPALAIAPPAPAPAAIAGGVDLSARGAGAQRHGWHRFGVGAGVTAVVLASASGYFGWRAARAADEVSNMFDAMGSWGKAGQDAEEAVARNNRLAVGTGLGALLACGFALWAWWEGK